MNRPEIIFGITTLAAAIGLWLMLPRGASHGRTLGVLLALASLITVAWHLNSLGEWSSDILFYVLAAITVVAAVATITFRNPVHCAIWFALSLLGTAGLFLIQGAQFLGVATIVVYAGAILVTFLFVLMLAQPQGDAFYDRISWEGLLSACTATLLVAVLTFAIFTALPKQKLPDQSTARFTQPQLEANILASEHMAHLGGQLFSRYLIAIEVAGTLLLVGLVGAVAIVIQASRFSPPVKNASPRIDPVIVTGREPVVAGSREVSRG